MMPNTVCKANGEKSEKETCQGARELKKQLFKLNDIIEPKMVEVEFQVEYGYRSKVGSRDVDLLQRGIRST